MACSLPLSLLPADRSHPAHDRGVSRVSRAKYTAPATVAPVAWRRHLGLRDGAATRPACSPAGAPSRAGTGAAPAPPAATAPGPGRPPAPAPGGLPGERVER